MGMNKDEIVEDDDEEQNDQNKSDQLTEVRETQIVKEKESVEEKGKIPNLFEKHDLFEDIDNIADLTIDQVKNLLEEEEKTNAKLKTDLYNQKDENIEKTRKTSQVKHSPDRKAQTK